MEPNEQETMDGSPALVETEYIRIKFQAGPIQEVGVNGCSIKDVIEVLVNRLEGFNEGPFRCRENSLAITHLQEAQNWLYRRMRLRQEQGVEGFNKPHTG